MRHRRTTPCRLAGLAGLALLVALASPACTAFEDLDKVYLRFDQQDDDDADGGRDAGDVGERGDAGDAGDSGDTGGSALPDASRFGDPTVNKCTRFPGVKECAAAFFCSLSFNDPTYSLLCRPPDHAGIGVEGDACASFLGECGQGLDCIDWSDDAIAFAADPRGQVCTPPCLIGTDEGCTPGDVCVHVFENIPGIGWCAPGCDPYADDCEQGQCSVDPAYPTKALLPRFRCLLHGGATQKSEGSACDPLLTETSGCPSGLICYEAEVDSGRYRCVQPCQADGDCDSGSCQEAQGEFGLRYCELG